jgi:pantetheine-phosphate adenylyltransferase
MKRKAVYAASLNPITIGHIHVAERAAALYDELMVVVAADSRKKYDFSVEERVEMAKAAVAHLPNVTVDACVGRFVVKYAHEIGAQVIVRGLRDINDLTNESTLAKFNRSICPHVETVLLHCWQEFTHVSSSSVRALIGVDPEWEAEVAKLVTPAVAAKLKENYLRSRVKP